MTLNINSKEVLAKLLATENIDIVHGSVDTASFNVKDPFGDFDLIFTAAFTGEKIIEFPIHYKSRTYGKTQISRFKDGYKLVKYLLKTYIVFNVSR